MEAMTKAASKNHEITKALRLRFWHWMTNEGIDQVPIESGSILVTIPQVCGWREDGSTTDAVWMSFAVEASNYGEAVKALEERVAETLAYVGATPREQSIAIIEKSETGNAIKVHYGA